MSGPSGRGPDFLAVVGPTATGKSALGLALAAELDGEIVSVDSRQIYRGMDVGTAKATAAERARTPHHGLDLRDPDERYGAGQFGRDARRWIAAIRDRGRIPILVGGTGFFLKALTDPLFREPPMDPSRRRALQGFLGDLERSELERWLRVLDPERFPIASLGGRQRVTRTLEVAVLTGRPMSFWHRAGRGDGPALEGVVCVLELDRGLLAERIERRARRMAAEGLLQEVKRLLAAGYAPSDPGMTGVGYREMVEHARGRATLEETVARISAATRRYARRQETWFRGQLGPDAVRVDAAAYPRRQLEAATDAWRRAVDGRRAAAKAAP